MCMLQLYSVVGLDVLQQQWFHYDELLVQTALLSSGSMLQSRIVNEANVILAYHPSMLIEQALS